MELLICKRWKESMLYKIDGSVIKDIKVFLEAYKLIGLGWIYAPTKLPIIDSLTLVVYGLWAKYRLKLTGLSYIEEISSSNAC